MYWTQATLLLILLSSSLDHVYPLRCIDTTSSPYFRYNLKQEGIGKQDNVHIISSTLVSWQPAPGVMPQVDVTELTSEFDSELEVELVDSVVGSLEAKY